MVGEARRNRKLTTRFDSDLAGPRTAGVPVSPAATAYPVLGPFAKGRSGGSPSRPTPAGASTARNGPVNLPVELEALRGHLPEADLAWAQRRARAVGVGGDEALICAGRLSPEDACAHLAAHLGLAVDPLDTPRAPPGLAAAVLRLGTVQEPMDDGPPCYGFAARGHTARRLARALARDPTLAQRARLVPPERLHAHMARHAAPEMGAAAAFALKSRRPEMSAASLTPSRRMLVPCAMAALALAGALGVAPAATVLAIEAVLSAVFLASAALRIAACFMEPPREVPLGLSDAQLPVYTIIVPLYREARMLPRLVAALQRLDYPPEKLDIKLAIEPDDQPMHARLKRMRLPPWFEVVVAPPVGPRTKPKALNAALPFARGSFIAVYDAEDVPAPDQLHRALAAFRGAGPRVGCVQARLSIENARDSWISRHFAAEYAGQFDVLLPGLAALGLPILLGGTSNHFRRVVLERVGAWDPYNVTEDADLGVRLARAGWGTAVIASTTEEEAPISRHAWMGQRTRWLKGWAQTILVHGRRPRALVREIGWPSALALALLTVGPFASALVHPLCLLVLATDAARGVLLMPSHSSIGVAASALSYTNLVVGYGAAALCSGLGLRRRGLLPVAAVLLTLPVYWLLMSVAAWRAVVELVTRPYWWEKTEHGLGRRRPLDGRPGMEPPLADPTLTDSASALPRPRPVAASC